MIPEITEKGKSPPSHCGMAEGASTLEKNRKGKRTGETGHGIWVKLCYSCLCLDGCTAVIFLFLPTAFIKTYRRNKIQRCGYATTCHVLEPQKGEQIVRIISSRKLVPCFCRRTQKRYGVAFSRRCTSRIGHAVPPPTPPKRLHIIITAAILLYIYKRGLYTHANEIL